MASSPAPPALITPSSLANLRLLSWWMHTNLPESSDASLLTSTLLVWLLRNAWQLDAEPASLFEYCDELQAALQASGVTNDWDVVHELKSSFTQVSLTRIHFDTLLLDIQHALLPGSAIASVPGEPVLNVSRQSPLGIWAKRLRLVGSMLDDEAVVAMFDCVNKWVEGEELELEAPIQPREVAYRAYRSAVRAGDYAATRREMERFLDFYPNGISGKQHHYALLHLAQFHFQNGGFAEARAAVSDGIHMARALADPECMSLLDSLSRKLEAEEKPVSTQQGPPDVRVLTTRPRDRPAYDEDDVWEMQRDVGFGAPLLRALTRLDDSAFAVGYATMAAEATAKLNATSGQSAEAAQVLVARTRLQMQRKSVAATAFRTTVGLALLWEQLGCQSVSRALRKAAWQESTVRKQPNEEEVRLSAAMLQADELAAGGSYEAAVTILIDAELIAMLSAQTYRDWRACLLRLLYVRSRRAGQSSDLRHLRTLRPELRREVEGVQWDEMDEGSGEASSKRAGAEGRFAEPRVTAWQMLLGGLRSARELTGSNQPAYALDQLMMLLLRCDKTDHVVLHRMSLVALAELQASELDMPVRSCATMEEILPACIMDHDLERRGTAEYTYARCLLARFKADDKAVEQLEQSMRWFGHAALHLGVVGALESQASALYHLARLQHQLARQDQAMQTLEQLKQVEEQMTRNESCRSIDDVTREVTELVEQVGTWIAAGV